MPHESWCSVYSQKENRPKTLCRRKPLACGGRIQVVKLPLIIPGAARGSQRLWDQGLMEKAHKNLLHSTTDPITTARLHARATKESGAWLNALPVPHLGTKLDNNTLRIAVCLRLGSDLVEEHKCVCGSQVSRKGTHGLSCRQSGGRFARHHAANETTQRALVSGGVPSVLESVGVCREVAKRPDGMTLIPWECGHSLLWDFTCVMYWLTLYVSVFTHA